MDSNTYKLGIEGFRLTIKSGSELDLSVGFNELSIETNTLTEVYQELGNFVATVLEGLK